MIGVSDIAISSRGTADYLAGQLSKIKCSRLFRRWSGWLGPKQPVPIFSRAQRRSSAGDEMSAKIVSEMVSRRKVFSIIGLSRSSSRGVVKAFLDDFKLLLPNRRSLAA